MLFFFRRAAGASAGASAAARTSFSSNTRPCARINRGAVCNLWGRSREFSLDHHVAHAHGREQQRKHKEQQQHEQQELLSLDNKLGADQSKLYLTKIDELERRLVEYAGPAQANKLSAPQQAMVYLNDVGLTRGDRPSTQIFVSSVLGGAFLSWGAAMYLTLGGGSPELMASAPGMHKIVSALIFPIGLSCIVLSGSDLLTSNMMYSTLPFVSKDSRKSTVDKTESLVHLWAVSAAGNAVGCVAMAGLTMPLMTVNPDMVAFAQAIAIKKTSGALMPTFLKAVGCNWLVNFAIFSATTANSSAGKMAVLWLPITTFVALGLEHVVANLYFVPLGMFLGADISVATACFANFLPVFAGNAVGASVFVSWMHWKSIMTGVTQPFTCTK